LQRKSGCTETESDLHLANVMPKRLDEYDQVSARRAQKAYSEILKLNYERHGVPSKIMPPKGQLYHYTSADGLKGIIESNELWATSAYFMNDSAEILYGCKLLVTALDGWRTQHQESLRSISFSMSYDLSKAFGEDLPKTVIPPIYLICFCEDDNLLSQWRAYGQSGGFSIGFKPNIGSRFENVAFTPEPKTYTSTWVKVEYERSKQVQTCNSLLESLLAVVDEVETERAIVAIEDHPLTGYSAFLKVIRELLLEEIIGFKNDAFKSENEWRIVVRPRELKKQGVDDGGKTPTPIYFRCSNGMPVPYVKVNGKAKGKLPISCIRSGPTLDKNLARIAISTMLNQNGFPGVPIEGSDITLRL
jgi:hypothetical protein